MATVRTTYKAVALATHLDVSLEDVHETKWETFEINPHMVRRGPSPIEIRADADRLHRVFKILELDAPTLDGVFVTVLAWLSLIEGPDTMLLVEDTINWTERGDEILYNTVKLALYWAKMPELVEINEERDIHCILNPLFYLLGSKVSDHETYYREDLRKAFDGLEIEDHRPNYSSNNGEYLVLDSMEVEIKLKEDAENYLSEFVYDQIPDTLQRYFNDEAYVEDFVDEADHGATLASYDGIENEISPDEIMTWLEKHWSELVESKLAEGDYEYNNIEFDDDPNTSEWLYIYRTN